MKLKNIIGSQNIWLFHPSEPNNDNVRTLHLIRTFESRYAFLQGPRVIADYDMTKGITFLHGQFKRRSIIDKCMIFTNGILAEARVPTEECDAFLSDVREWFRQESGSSPNEIGRTYLSQLEVESKLDLGKALNVFSKFGQQIAGLLKKYNQVPRNFELSGLTFHCDQTDIQPPKPFSFRIERREAQPYSAGLYFAVAPLQTADHLRCLDALENLLIS